jgi:hypothetical protein
VELTIQSRNIYHGSLKVHLAADDDCVLVMGQTVHGLETDSVDFVIDIKAWYVLPRSYQDVDELIGSDLRHN